MDVIQEGMLASAKAAEAAARIGERLFCQNTPNVMSFNSQICTSRIQSERLLALGLKPETADMCWQTTTLNGEAITYPSQDVWMNGSIITNNHFPAWSLHRLWELLPKSIWHDNGLEKKYHPIIEYGFVNYVTECGMELFDFDCGYEVWESMIVVIEWLINEGYFNKEYLEER